MFLVDSDFDINAPNIDNNRVWDSCANNPQTPLFFIYKVKSYCYEYRTAISLTFTRISSSCDESQNFAKLIYLGFPYIDKHFHVLLCYLADGMRS